MPTRPAPSACSKWRINDVVAAGTSAVPRKRSCTSNSARMVKSPTPSSAIAVATTWRMNRPVRRIPSRYHRPRPASAIPLAHTDANHATERDATWRPLRATPNFPEYPSAHACHSSAVVETLANFFGTDDVRLSLDSQATGTTRSFDQLHEVVKDVEQARVLVGFHFRNSDLEGSILGRKVARFVSSASPAACPNPDSIPTGRTRTQTIGQGSTV